MRLGLISVRRGYRKLISLMYKRLRDRQPRMIICGWLVARFLNGWPTKTITDYFWGLLLIRLAKAIQRTTLTLFNEDWCRCKEKVYRALMLTPISSVIVLPRKIGETKIRQSAEKRRDMFGVVI